ncbi:MAG: T9SS type A sorting domain-containing protein [Flavobacterium sp.]|nr:T9SS type A sorting domain-containing protein [Flavobacterium sp.]
MKNVLFIYAILLFTANSRSYAQGENDNWYFGNKAAVNFSAGSPVQLSNSNMIQLEGVASISDANGNLLFYTNGINVWDKTNTIMPNGSGLLGHDSSIQSAVIVPFPGIMNKYYIFTSYVTYFQTPNLNNNPYNYSIVDMNLNGNKGDIIPGQKNLPIFGETSSIPLLQNGVSGEAMTSTLSNNLNSYWLLIPVTYPTNKLFAYKIDNSGLINSPITSTLDFLANTHGPVTGVVNQTHIRINQSLRTGLRLLSISKNYSNYQTKIYNFDCSTGTINSLIGECNDCNTYSSEFNGDLLYLASHSNGLNVINTVNGAFRQITNPSFEAGLQMAKNGIIYAAKYTVGLQPGIVSTVDINSQNGLPSPLSFSNPFLYQIDNSTSFNSSSVNFINPFSLGGLRTSGYGLPQYIPVIGTTTCVPFRVLSNFNELTYNFYNASINITTANNYTTNSGSTVILKAGTSVVLNPGTHLKAGSNFTGKIELCSIQSRLISNSSIEKAHPPFRVSITNQEDNLNIYPNPVTNGVFYINTNSLTEKNVLIFNNLGIQELDINTTEIAVNVEKLKKGFYILRITQENKTTTTKLIIK